MITADLTGSGAVHAWFRRGSSMFQRDSGASYLRRSWDQPV